MMNLRVALLWGMTARFASSSLPMPSSCGHSDEELCGQSDEALDMLQHGAMPKDSRSKAVPGMDLFAARKSLTQTGGKGRVACDFQTAGFTCLNWENLLLWWLPLGRNYHGWLALLVILAVLVLGGRFTKQTEPAKELELSSGAIDRQVNFWCNDMPAHRSVYFAMASSVLWLATMVDHPVYSEPEVKTLPINAVPWWILFMPAAICILLAGSSSSLKLLWLKAAIVTMTMATIGYVACESSFTTRVDRGHRYLIVSWAFLGVVLALCGLLLAPEAKVSSWLRKYAMLVCCVSYINGSISKLLNSKPFLSWANGQTFVFWTKTLQQINAYFSTWGIPYPWLSRQIVEHEPFAQLLCWANLFLEGPLSIAALIGLGCFGRFGPARMLWCLAAVAFHFGVNLVWGNHEASLYNLETFVNLILVVDVPGIIQNCGRPLASEAVPEAMPPTQRDHSSMALAALAIVCSIGLFAWVTVGVFLHFDDPKWPITSVPMFSMTCGIQYCDESFRSSVIKLSVWHGLCISSALTAIVFLRPAGKHSQATK